MQRIDVADGAWANVLLTPDRHPAQSPALAMIDT
jgi:hypothetical protein